MSPVNQRRKRSNEKTVFSSQKGEQDWAGDIFTHYHPEEIPRLHVYCYHHLDDLSFLRRPREVFPELGRSDLKRLVDAVKSRFLSAGWEGDGEVDLIWLPPFVDTGIEDTWGNYLWHVKQENNGSSWIGSKHPLNFIRIREQNEQRGNGTYVSIVYHAGKSLAETAKRILEEVRQKIAALQSLNGTVADDIRNDLLTSAQGELVSELQIFLDECYLEVLLQVLDEGNPGKLRLGKFKASLNLSYMPANDGEAGVRERERAEVAQWLTLKGLIGDIWRSFKFEAFASKTQMVFNACDYKPSDDVRRSVIKHVQLRNCIQHQSRVVTDEALRIAGVKEFMMLTDGGGSVKLAAGKPIAFSVAELEDFCDSLVKLATEFDHHMGDRTRPVWVSEPRQ